MPPDESGPPEQGKLGELIADCFARHGFAERDYGPLSTYAGLGDQWVSKTIKRKASTARRGTLLKIAAALDLSPQERAEMEQVAGLPRNSLRATKAEEVCERDGISMRRAIILLTAPTDPHLSPLRVKMPGVALRTGVIFGWHDVVTRVTTPDNATVFDYAERLFNGKKLRSIETIPIRDDLPTFIDREFDERGLEDSDDYWWAVIFVQTLGTPTKPEIRNIFHQVSQGSEFKGGIHLLTAAVAVGQFDTVIEVLAGNLGRLQKYVRVAQSLAKEAGWDVHTVTYFSQHWQRVSEGCF